MQKKHYITLTLLAVLLGLAYVVEHFYLREATVIYPNFGIALPAGYSTHGIDVSRYQRKINWKLVSEMRDKGQKISFVIIKATEGTNLTDPYFHTNWKNSKEYPLLRGAYLYFHPNKSGVKQAEYFISKVDLQSGDLPPVIDIEETNRQSKSNIQKELKACIEVLTQKYGQKPILYSGVDFYTQHLKGAFDEYPFWAAHYEQLKAPRIERDWLIWQHNCKGRVNGIEGEVDFNVVNGSLFALQDLCL